MFYQNFKIIESCEKSEFFSKYFTGICRYTPVQLPRADMKPYHESYFSDNPTPPLTQSHTSSSHHSSQVSSNRDGLPVEGLAASLHARIINNQNSNIKSDQSTANNSRR